MPPPMFLLMKKYFMIRCGQNYVFPLRLLKIFKSSDFLRTSVIVFNSSLLSLLVGIPSESHIILIRISYEICCPS